MVDWMDELTKPDAPAKAPEVDWMDLATTMPETPSMFGDKVSSQSLSDLVRGPSAGSIIAQKQQAAEANIPPSGGVMSAIGNFFTGNNRETPESRQYPEVGNPVSGLKGDFMPSLKAGLGQLASSTDAQRVDILKKQFPQLGFDVDAKGNVIIDGGEQGKFVLNKPGASFQDILDTVGTIAAYSPAARGAASLKTTPQRIVGSGVGGAATSVALDAASGGLGSEQGIDPWRAGLAAGGEMLLPSTGALLRKAFGGSKVGPMGMAELQGTTPQTMQGVIDASKQTGIDLFPAQKTGLVSALEKQNTLANLPGSAQTAAKALKKQNEQVYSAVNDFMGTIAPPSAVSTGAVRFQGAGDKLRESLVKARSERSSPIYKDAFSEGLQIDTSPVIQMGKDIIDKYPAGGKIASPVARITKMIEQANGDLEKLHNVKTEIDQTIETGLGANGTPLRGTAKARLEDIKHALLDQMDASSEKYRAARASFEEGSKPVNEFDNSILGVVSDKKQTQLKGLSTAIFDASETNPEVVKRTREMIDAVDPGAYDELLRVELERRIGSAPIDKQGIQNAPQQMLASIYGNRKQAAVLMNALRPEQQKFAANLYVALNAASSGRFSNSSTAFRQPIVEELTKGGPWNRIVDWVTQPSKTLQGIGLEMASRNRQAAIAKIMYDPSYTKDVNAAIQLMKSDPTTAQKNLDAILNAALADSTKDLMN